MTEPDATVQRELDAVDEALASGAATATGRDERALQDLALALAAQAPAPDLAFAARLRGRAAAGFPRPRSRVARVFHRPASHDATKPRRRPRMRHPAVAVAATVALAVVIAIPLMRGDTGQESFSGGGSTAVEDGGAAGGSSLEATPRTGAPAPGITDQSRESDFAPGRDERRIERSASLTLAAPEERLDAVGDEVIAVVDRYEGFVLESSLTTGDQGTTGGDFELRVPADRLQAALRDLSELGEVRGRTQAGQDVTRAFVGAGDRLEAAQAQRRGLLTRLEQAQTDTEAESIRRQLDLNAIEISGLRANLRDLRLRTDYATVDLALESDESAGGAASGSPRDGLGGALDDALGSLSASLELLVRGLGIGIPLLLAACALLLGARTTQRRRRERALA